MEIHTKDLFAKILANENIDVIESSYADTAAFDLKDRKLILPIWEKVTDNLSRMLLAHEVSHALHTPSDGWFSAIDGKPENDRDYFRTILNVVEDVRIDRLIMTRYPGLKSDYRFGMRELRERDFFGAVFGEGHFLSRLNTHLKYNISGQNFEEIIFDNLEFPLVEEAIMVQTWEDVVIISEKIFSLIPPSPSLNFPTGYNKKLSNDGCRNPFECEGLEKLIQESSKETFRMPPSNSFKNSIVQSRKDIISDLLVIPNRKNVQRLRTIYNKKKMAQRLKERQYRKMGTIDTNSLHRYTPTGNIFSKEAIFQKEKNHCIIVLVDGSGSMKGNMHAVAQKVFEIYEFCRLEKIPFMCYQFKDAEGYLPNISGGKGGYRLYQYFSRNKTAVDLTILSNSADGTTPFCSSLLAMFPIIEECRKKYADSKISLITLTDGACDSSGLIYENYIHPVHRTIVKSGLSCHNRLDSSTALYKMMRDIYDCKVISFYLNRVKDSGIKTFYDKGGANVHYEIEVDRLDVENSQEETKILESFIETIS